MTVIKLIRNFGTFISATLIFLITVLMILQIIARYVFNAPLDWAEEACILAFFAMIFFGALSADHIRITSIVEKFSSHLQKVISTLNLLLQTAYFSVIIYLFLAYYKFSATTTTNVLEFPMYILFAIIPFIFLLILIKDWLLFLKDRT